MRAVSIAAVIVGAVILGNPSVSVAGPFANHPDALSNELTGSAPFNDGVGHTGVVDYAVFTAGDFNANFSGFGYVPGDAFVYAYQMLATNGTYDITGFVVHLQGSANTIGTFKMGDVAPSTTQFVGAAAQWLFMTGLEDGQTSWALVFSSPELPIFGFGEILPPPIPYPNYVAVPIPYAAPVPEPGSLALLATGAATAYIRRRVGRSRRAAYRSRESGQANCANVNRWVGPQSLRLPLEWRRSSFGGLFPLPR